MTQVKSAQRAGRKLASTPRARQRTLAERRADLEQRIRSHLASDATMALIQPEQVKQRMKLLRERAGNPTQYEVAAAINVPPRTFQSWENAEVETDRRNYELVATFYSKRLDEKVTANWILFGQDEEPPLTSPALMANGDDPLHKLDEILEGQRDLSKRLLVIEELLAQATPAEKRSIAKRSQRSTGPRKPPATSQEP